MVIPNKRNVLFFYTAMAAFLLAKLLTSVLSNHMPNLKYRIKHSKEQDCNMLLQTFVSLPFFHSST